MDTNTKIKAIDMAIAALKDAAKFTDMGFAFEGDVFGIHHNDALDALNDYANAIADLETLRDAVTADPTLADCAQDVTEFDESQFKSVEDLIAHLNKLNSYRNRTLEALSKYKGAKGGCITQK